jgi:hypothetical protein
MSAAPRTGESKDVFGSEQKSGGGIPFSLGRDNLRKVQAKILSSIHMSKPNAYFVIVVFMHGLAAQLLLRNPTWARLVNRYMSESWIPVC